MADAKSTQTQTRGPQPRSSSRTTLSLPATWKRVSQWIENVLAFLLIVLTVGFSELYSRLIDGLPEGLPAFFESVDTVSKYVFYIVSGEAVMLGPGIMALSLRSGEVLKTPTILLFMAFLLMLSAQFTAMSCRRWVIEKKLCQAETSKPLTANRKKILFALLMPVVMLISGHVFSLFVYIDVVLISTAHSEC
ncbi:hypothetical protein NLI96_g3870 [Meripilus lineatus]|uniref:Uncharacterized protein n=1 Tax=Meripilus lineatus TaxID=2056292 RepID=A0AAD5VAX4_9APHY|nr:hypothetical protein NLI96_g3870 [Physisporinus lineatus]